MKYIQTIKYLLTTCILLSISLFLPDQLIIAQSRSQDLEEIQKLVKEEGEIFIVVDYLKAGENKLCREENSLINLIQFTPDSAFVNYINYTELFCEAYILRTQYTYHFSQKDIELSNMRLVEKKYDYGNGKLQKGPSYWFEVQLFTQEKKPAIRKRDVESKTIENISTVSLLFKSKEGAKAAFGLLKTALHELPGQ